MLIAPLRPDRAIGKQETCQHTRLIFLWKERLLRSFGTKMSTLWTKETGGGEFEGSDLYVCAIEVDKTHETG